MRPELFRRIPELESRNSDFAYFCSFSDPQRMVGRELLMTSDSAPVSGKGPIPSDTLREVESARGMFPPDYGPFYPVFISYDYLQNIFNYSLKHQSRWPHYSLLMPNSVELSYFSRPEEISTPAKSRPEIAPEERRRLTSSIGEVRDLIRDGEMLQAVISCGFPLSQRISLYDLTRHFLINDRSRYVYYYSFGDFRIVGSSPENIFRQTGRELLISPIAGTRPRRSADSGEGLIQDLITDQKETCEHRMLVDLARNDLARISQTGSVNVTMDMFPEEFSSVVHLVSMVQSRSREGITPLDTLKSVFPAGTVSGAPKLRAIETIDSFETAPRGGYAGGIGIVGPRMADIALGIRTLFSSPDGTYTQAGAGIVKDSDPDREVEEILAKAGTVVSGVKT